MRPQAAQRLAAQPVLRAAALEQQETERVQIQRQDVTKKLATLGEIRPVQRQQEPQAVPAQPATPTEWVTVMRHRAAEVEGQPLDARQHAHWTALQRQAAQTLAQGFRGDRGPAQARYETYGEHLASLQQHPISAPVSRVMLGLVPSGERLALQRAVHEASSRLETQAQQAAVFVQAQTLQRQLAELDAEATQPVLQRIQARRGSGNPLPEAIQRHLEQGLNHDLSRVRIHDDAEADKLAKGVNAVAFTTGTDIFFQAGKFSPNTQSGLELLAHEVTHTVQQSQGRVGKGIDPDAGLEREAQAMGRTLATRPRAARGLEARPRRLPQLRGPVLAVQRLQAKPHMTWPEFQAILKAKLLQRLSQNAAQLKTETGKYQKTGATPQWQNLLRLLTADRQVQAQQQQLVRGMQQKYPQGLAGLPFPSKLREQATAPNPAHWATYERSVTKQLGARGAPFVEAMRQLAAAEGLRAAAHKAFPALSALAATQTALQVVKTPELLREMKAQFAATTSAIGDLKTEIQAGQIPWKHTNLVVQDILRDYKVKPDAPAVKAYQQALKAEQHSQVVALLLTAGVSIAAILATGPASLALGTLAAASGGGQAYLHTQDPRKQLDVATASRFGQNLTSVQADAAQFQLAMGYLNIALSMIDLAAVGKVLAVTTGSALVGQGMVKLERLFADQGLLPGHPLWLGQARVPRAEASRATL